LKTALAAADGERADISAALAEGGFMAAAIQRLPATGRRYTRPEARRSRVGGERMARVWAVLGLWAGMGATLAKAQEMVGAPRPWQMNFPEQVTEVGRATVGYHDVLLWVTGAITLFVLGLLLYVIVRFRASRNPRPARFTHNPLLEVIWTAVPVVVLLAMVIPSLRLLYLQEEPPEADLVIKATGNQWYWSYEYPDEGIAFDALMMTSAEMSDAGMSDDMFLLATDQAVVVPVDKVVRVQVTASDVIHAWAVPNFGVKVDAVPGRLNQTWFRAEREGVFYGQCSELCGKDHAFMPIAVKVVGQEAYSEWLAGARDEFSVDAGPVAPLFAARN